MVRRDLVVGLVSLALVAAGTMMVLSRGTGTTPSFHPSSPSLLASTGRPQLVEFFHHQ